MGLLDKLKKGPKSAERVAPTGPAAQHVAATREGVRGVDVGDNRLMNWLRVAIATAALGLASVPNSACEYPENGTPAEAADPQSYLNFLRTWGITVAKGKIVLPGGLSQLPGITAKIEAITVNGSPLNPSEYPLKDAAQVTEVPAPLMPGSQVTVTYTWRGKTSEPLTSTVPGGNTIVPERPTPRGVDRTVPGDEPGGTPSEGNAA